MEVRGKAAYAPSFTFYSESGTEHWPQEGEWIVTHYDVTDSVAVRIIRYRVTFNEETYYAPPTVTPTKEESP
jgi:hypothetical protein